MYVSYFVMTDHFVLIEFDGIPLTMILHRTHEYRQVKKNFRTYVSHFVFADHFELQ